MKYRKKPVVIEAFLFGIDNIPDWFMDKVTSNDVTLYSDDMYLNSVMWCEINTLEGVMTANYGKDYIVKGVDGELYPCKKDIFEKTYEAVEE